MWEEFCTECEDNSISGIADIKMFLFCHSKSALELIQFIVFILGLSEALVGFLILCIDGKFDEIRQRISALLPCVNWLDPSFKLTPISSDEDDSDSSDEGDHNMDTSADNEAPNLVNANQRTQRNRPQVDEDGWTTIPSRRRQ